MWQGQILWESSRDSGCVLLLHMFPCAVELATILLSKVTLKDVAPKPQCLEMSDDHEAVDVARANVVK
eukprot:1401061-Amphidinium_carterae.2